MGVSGIKPQIPKPHYNTIENPGPTFSPKNPKGDEKLNPSQM
jgi:hypothetical protein